ncbi:hypothetical protein DXA36_12970 [Eisenbergiella sp. OF01-20]|nr:hypothetical protein DXA36_12970 [Eisenbergiella sp. OF01-20]
MDNRCPSFFMAFAANIRTGLTGLQDNEFIIPASHADFSRPPQRTLRIIAWRVKGRILVDFAFFICTDLLFYCIFTIKE